ncbi:MAG: hypothetical protein HKN15_08190 [Xanthomonadales bacterium]|nr:hypothetical protein [Xanthomonadales bacterium]
MKPSDTTHPEPGLEQDLKHIEQQYRKLGNDEPPAMLDQAILNKARRAVKSHAARPWSFGWMHATATAALLVLGLSVILQLRSQLEPVAPPATVAPEPIDAISKDTDGRQDAGANAMQSPAFGDLDATVPAEAEEDIARGSKSMQSDPAALRDEADQNNQALEKNTAGGFRQRRAATPAGAEVPTEEGADHEMFNYPASDEAAPEPGRKAELTPARKPGMAGQAELRESAEDSRTQAMSESVIDHASPEEWLNAIVAMKNDDPDSNWLAELRQFIKQNPQHPLPESLQQALADKNPP